MPRHHRETSLRRWYRSHCKRPLDLAEHAFAAATLKNMGNQRATSVAAVDDDQSNPKRDQTFSNRRADLQKRAPSGWPSMICQMRPAHKIAIVDIH